MNFELLKKNSSRLNSLFWVISALGFGYQCFTILEIYFLYPTTTNIQRPESQENLEIPAISVCIPQVMLIQLSRLEPLYPNISKIYDEIAEFEKVIDFDQEYRKIEYLWEKFIVFLKSVNITKKQLRSTFMKTIIIDCKRLNETKTEEAKDCTQFTNVTVSYDDNTQCYTLFYKTSDERAKNPSILHKSLNLAQPYLAFYILLNVSDGLVLPRRGRLVIHAPHTKPLESIANSIELQNQGSYLIQYTKTTTILLESPYAMDCIYYFDNTVYGSQRNCYDQCLTDHYKRLCDCFPDHVHLYNITEEDKVCWQFRDRCAHNSKLLIERNCQTRCHSPDCIRERYNFQVRYFHLRVRNSSDAQLMAIKTNTAKVIINTPVFEEEIIIHTPKYQLMELICYIASLLGFWFGLSVTAISIIMKDALTKNLMAINTVLKSKALPTDRFGKIALNRTNSMADRYGKNSTAADNSVFVTRRAFGNIYY